MQVDICGGIYWINSNLKSSHRLQICPKGLDEILSKLLHVFSYWNVSVWSGLWQCINKIVFQYNFSWEWLLFNSTTTFHFTHRHIFFKFINSFTTPTSHFNQCLLQMCTHINAHSRTLHLHIILQEAKKYNSSSVQ